MRHFKTQEELDQERRDAMPLKPGQMLTNRKLIIYARQSTKDQALNNRESTEQQTTDLLALGLDYGWSQEDTTLYIENRFTKDGKVTDEIRNASGTLRIDQRPGLNAVKGRIEGGEVGAVLVWDVSRLFRDEDMVEPALFAKECKSKKVLVLTNDDLFNFNDTRRNDSKRFCDDAQAAADFITKHIRKMNLARDKKAARGDWAGSALPVGYTVDASRKHLLPFPPHAEKVAYLFKRFRELGSVVALLGKEAYNNPVFPDVPGNNSYIQLKRVPGGYTFNSVKSPLAEARGFKQSVSQTCGGVDRDGSLLASSRPVFVATSMEGSDPLSTSTMGTPTLVRSCFSPGERLSLEPSETL